MRPLHVVFLLNSFGFPHGMASTNRVKLLSRALLEQQVRVTVLCTRVSERRESIVNRLPSGVDQGITYTYTTGSTVRPDSFGARRLSDVRGLLGALGRLTAMRRSGQLDCVYVPSCSKRWRLGPWVLANYLTAIGVPVIVELTELPWSVDGLPRTLAKRFSPLAGAAGVVAISEWLARWASREARRLGRDIPMLELPVVVDVMEQGVTEVDRRGDVLVYSASPGDRLAWPFMAEVMQAVWYTHPECVLLVTGNRDSGVLRTIEDVGIASRAGGSITHVGYLERAALLRLYASASALLAPLFADERSHARFPSKIAEYLAASRPVVTTGVGEVVRYLSDGESAYVSAPDDVEAYARRIRHILDHPDESDAVGRAGREVATNCFHYALHGAGLRSFIESLLQS